MKRKHAGWDGAVRAAIVLGVVIAFLVSGGCRKATAADEEAATLQALEKIYSDAADILEGIHGKADGTAAAPKLETLAARAKQLADDRPKQQPLTFAQAKELNSRYDKAIGQAERRFETAMNRIRSDRDRDPYWEIQPAYVHLRNATGHLMMQPPPQAGSNGAARRAAAPTGTTASGLRASRSPKTVDEAQQQFVEKYGADRVARVELTEIPPGVKWDHVWNRVTRPPAADCFGSQGRGKGTIIVAPISGSLSGFADNLEVGQVLSVDYAQHLIRTTVDAAKFPPPAAEAKP